MIKVFQKSAGEKRAEIAAKRQMLADDQVGLQFVGQKICPTYVIDREGHHIDTDDLTEDQILTFVGKGIMQTVTAQKAQARDSLEASQGVQALLHAVNNRYRPSLAGMRNLIELYYHDDVEIRFCATQVLSEFIAAHQDFANIDVIAKYVKRSQNNFEPIDKADRLAVVDNMMVHELNETIARCHSHTTDQQKE